MPKLIEPLWDGHVEYRLEPIMVAGRSGFYRRVTVRDLPPWEDGSDNLVNVFPDNLDDWDLWYTWNSVL